MVSDDIKTGVIDWKRPRASIQYEPGDFFRNGNEQDASEHPMSLTCPSDECSRVFKTLSNNECVYVSFGILGPSPRDFVLTTPMHDTLSSFAKQVPLDIAKAFSLFFSETPPKEQLQQLEKLIESNQSLVRTRYDGTPLLLLACNSRYAMDSQNLVKLLLERGADPNITNLNGRSALACIPNIDICRILVAAGADVNFAEPETGDTLLHLAVNNGEPWYPAFLLEHGANQNIRNKKGKLPRDYVRTKAIRAILCPDVGPPSVDFGWYWGIWDSSFSESEEQYVDNLRAKLKLLSKGRALEFCDLYHFLLAQLENNVIYAASLLIGAGESDDSFLDVRRWLLSRGSSIYERAVKQPHSLKYFDDAKSKFDFPYLEEIVEGLNWDLEGESSLVLPDAFLPDYLNEIDDPNNLGSCIRFLAQKMGDPYDICDRDWE